MKGYGSLSEIAASIKMYSSGDALPQVKAKTQIKEGELEKKLDEKDTHLQTLDGQLQQEKNVFQTEEFAYRPAQATTEDYADNAAVSKMFPDKDSVEINYREVEERIRDGKFRAMGVSGGTNMLNNAKKNAYWNDVLSKMSGNFAMTSALYSLA